MIVSLALVLAGIVLLWAGAEALVRGAAGLALAAGLSPLVVGLTVVAFGTSTPELLVSVESARLGAPEVAVGNVVGSNIANILLILGLSAAISPLRAHVQVLRRDIPAMILASVAFAAVLPAGVGRTLGAVSLLALATYTGLTVWWARRSPVEDVEPPTGDDLPAERASVPMELALTGGGLVVLMIGARLLLSGAIDLAGALGVPERIIALTVVAVGTSLPELATSVLSAWRGQSDIAIGNVVGSNVFNLLGILGVAAMVAPIPGGSTAWVDVTVMVGAALVLLPLAWTGAAVSRAEGGVLVAGYGAWLAWVAAA